MYIIPLPPEVHPQKLTVKEEAETGVDQHIVQQGKLRPGLHLLAHPRAQRRAPPQEKGHVGAQAAGQLKEAGRFQGLAVQLVEPQQGGGGVGGASPQTGGRRHPLLQMQAGPGRTPRAAK